MTLALAPSTDPRSALDHGFAFSAMASPCEVRIAGLSEAEAEPLARLAMAEVQRIEAKYSRYRPDSQLSQINQAAGTGRPVQVDAETDHLLDFVDQLYGQSDGLFDVTSGSLRQHWDFKRGRKPDPSALREGLKRVGWGRVYRDGPRIALPVAGMELDFGGFGKEYAADRVSTLLQQAGVRHGMVNLGGDVRVLGPRPDGRPWVIGIQHPRDVNGLLAEMALSGGALATSGDYERYFIDESGARHCHILNPRSGWPVTHWQCISVLAPTCLAAGALCTVAMLMGPRALDFLDEQGVSYLTVDRHGQRVHRLPSP